MGATACCCGDICATAIASIKSQFLLFFLMKTRDEKTLAALPMFAITRAIAMLGVYLARFSAT